ncbi:VOC family protein [Lysobacter sp. HA35]
MIDHLGISVRDFDASHAFYTAVLAPLGYAPIKDVTPEMSGNGTRHAGFGRDGMPAFWIGTRTDDAVTRDGLHIAFAAASRADVDAFHAAALAAGARDNGPPGPRPQYHRGYYGAFVIDLDGHNIEAVCRRPEAS